MTQNNKCHNPKHIYSPHYPCACNIDSMTKNNKPQSCEKNCPDFNGMAILHAEQCSCPCHSPHRDMEGWERELMNVAVDALNDKNEPNVVTGYIVQLPDAVSFIRTQISQARKEGDNRGRQAERTRILEVTDKAVEGRWTVKELKDFISKIQKK